MVALSDKDQGSWRSVADMFVPPKPRPKPGRPAGTVKKQLGRPARDPAEESGGDPATPVLALLGPTAGRRSRL